MFKLITTLALFVATVVSGQTSFEKDIIITNDSYLISIIFSNLLSNAIKYSQENGIIFVNLEKENNHIVCKIIDNGIGISKEDLEKIGSRFYRSQKVEHAEIKGTGLGLSIVADCARLLGGLAEIIDVSYADVCIQVRLPLVEDAV